MRPVLSFSAPANLLLMGEYAITLEGGRGVSVAVEPRAVATLTAAENIAYDQIPTILRERGGDGLLIIARMGAGDFKYTENATALHDAICAEFGLSGAAHTREDAPLRLEIDTTAFFDPDTGTKRGLGSSAVASLLATAAIGAILDSALEEAPAEVIRRAIAVHRQMHEGRGSGYDVATSALGGFVAFSGGAAPSARRLSPASESDPRAVRLYSLATGKPVHSATAVRRFEEFVGPRERHRFLQKSNELATAFETARRWCDLFMVVESARHLSEEIGETIGVGATLPFNSSHQDDGWIAKASGAGNERAVVLAKADARRPLPTGAELLSIARRGLAREDLTR